jgi:(5-formylfuran-3-yl)methyl phosphate synthase
MDLLLSLQSADELHIASNYSFRWLDLKNPLAGSLGCPEEEVAEEFLEVADQLPGRSEWTLSVAIGELLKSTSTCKENGVDKQSQFPLPLSHRNLNRFDYVKVALAGSSNCLSWTDRAASLSQQLGAPSKLILVHYADHHLAGAVDWTSTLSVSRDLGCEYILVDTFDKKAGRLTDWLSPNECRRCATEAERLGLKLSLAGSLRIEDFRTLKKTGASILGIRGAACAEGSRVSGLCRDRLQKLSRYLANGRLAIELR